MVEQDGYAYGFRAGLYPDQREPKLLLRDINA